MTPEQQITNYKTYEHIYQVQTLLLRALSDLQQRLITHDRSKLEEPELSIFTEYTPKLGTATYDSPEYRQFLREMKPALDNHYAENAHHPEHFDAGINGMNLIDVLEMLCDWMASVQRNPNGDIDASLQKSASRFGISTQLELIMRNTIHVLGDTPDNRPRNS